MQFLYIVKYSCKLPHWWDTGMVISLGQGANLHMAQLMPSCICCFQSANHLQHTRIVIVILTITNTIAVTGLIKKLHQYT